MLLTSRLPRAQVGISRLSIGPDRLMMTPRIPPEDTFVAAIYLTPLRHHELWRAGRLFLQQGYPRFGMRIVNLEGGFAARATEPHESLVLYLPRLALDDIAEEADIRRVASLACTPGVVDPLMVGLAHALAPALERRVRPPSLFTDHLVLAFCAHLIERYAELPRTSPAARGGLSSRQAALAESYILANLAEDITLADLAAQCGLSRSYFVRAFRRSKGVSPHQWLLRRRVEAAQAKMLASDASLAEVAISCGFADQSHLTRVFGRRIGMSPAKWRKAAKE